MSLFQAAASAQGRQFADQCARAMLDAAVRLGYLDDVISVYDPSDSVRLKRL